MVSGLGFRVQGLGCGVWGDFALGTAISPSESENARTLESPQDLYQYQRAFFGQRSTPHPSSGFRVVECSAQKLWLRNEGLGRSVA
eukprot:3908229-Rhodomonas_salina.2